MVIGNWQQTIDTVGPVVTETHGILDSSLWGDRTLEYVEALGCLTCHLFACMNLFYFMYSYVKPYCIEC